MSFDLAFVKKHPYEIGAVAAGAVILYFILRGSSGGSSGSSNQDALSSSFFAAQSAQAQAGDALQAVQIQAQASTTQDLINASADVTNNNTWSATDLAEVQSNNAAQVSLAPFQTEQSLIGVLGGVSSQTSTTSSSYSTGSTPGFFGIGATPSKSVASTTTAPTPAAEQASSELSALLSTGFNASN